ncbi:MAG TPA: hypothetical protein VFQ28_05545 [Gaiella sp.]|nr:hypothetical protein [Gaiella sp.]
MTHLTRFAQTGAAAVVVALALCAAATAGTGPAISAGAGCSISCIESALVTPTASSASVEIRTSVRTSVTVAVAEVGAPLGIAGGTPSGHVTVPPFVTLRTVLVPGLEPETTYRIVVTARDLQGRTQTRAGTFTTRKVKVAVDLPDVGLSSGLGCKVDCLTRGTLTSDESVPGRARLVVESSVPATFQVLLVARRPDGSALHQLGHSTGSRKTSHAVTLDGLLTGTPYAVTAKATDAEGRTWTETGTFRTRSAVAVTTFHKLVVLEDGDKVGRGEIAFDFYAAGELVRTFGFRRIGSGDTFVPTMSGTSRPGIWSTTPIDGSFRLRLLVAGVECDWQRLSRCPREANLGDRDATAEADVELRAAFASDDALPAGYGGDLPAGHDAYAVFQTESGKVRFRVYATVDVRVA